jgi:hypothetical protein
MTAKCSTQITNRGRGMHQLLDVRVDLMICDDGLNTKSLPMDIGLDFVSETGLFFDQFELQVINYWSNNFFVHIDFVAPTYRGIAG